MSLFTEKEITLILIYDPGNRSGTIYELREMMRQLMPDEQELKELTQGVIEKLERLDDREFDELFKETAMSALEPLDFEDAAYEEMEFLFDDEFYLKPE